MRLFDLPPREQQHKPRGKGLRKGANCARGPGLSLRQELSRLRIAWALQAIEIFFVISFMKRAFSNSRRIIIGVDGETQGGQGGKSLSRHCGAIKRLTGERVSFFESRTT